MLTYICSKYHIKVLRHVFLHIVLYNVELYQCFRKVIYNGQNTYSNLFDVCGCSNGLQNYSFQCVPFLFIRTLVNVLLGTKHEGSLDADDLMVLHLSFLILLLSGGKV